MGDHVWPFTWRAPQALSRQPAANDSPGYGPSYRCRPGDPQGQQSSCHLMAITWETPSKNGPLSAVYPQSYERE